MALDPAARLWTAPAFRPEEIETGLEYRTEILLSRDGTEQRRAQRDRPRRSIAFQSRVSEECFRELRRDLISYQRGPWAVGNPTTRVLATSGMANGANQITLASVPAWAAVGEKVVLRDEARFGLYTIDSIASLTLTFDEINTGVAWPVGTKVMEALPARLADTISMQSVSPDVGFASIDFDVTPGEAFYAEPGSAPDTFNGREAWLCQPWRSDPISAQHQSALETLDYGIGAVAYFEPVTRPTLIQRLDYRPAPASYSLFEDLFIRSRGRRTAFYMPTWRTDFAQVGSETSGSSSLTVEGDFTDLDGDAVFTAIAVEFLDDTFELRTVTSIAANGSDSDFTLGATWGRAVDATTVRRIMWCPQWRFASDKLTTVWRAEIYPRVTFNLQTVEST